MRQTIALSILVVLCLSSCGRGKAIETFFAEEDNVDDDSIEAYVGDTLHLFEEVVPPPTIDEIFNDFFFEFAGDVRFQKQRVRFPLVCRSGDEVVKMSRTEWADENRFDGQEFLAVIYEREQDVELQKDTAVGQVTVDWVHLQDEMIDTYHFKRYDGLWVLMDIAKAPVEQHSNGDFLQFYSRFMTDSIYQCDALADPLRLVITPQEEDDDTQFEDITSEDWSILKADLPFNTTQLITVDYGQQLSGANNKTLSIEGLSNGFLIKLKFTKDDEQWKLYEIEY